MLDPEAIAKLRHESRLRGLREVEAAAEPFAQFAAWFAEIQAVSPLEPTAMTLATATPDGRPSARMVLLKGWDARGFVFYTNYESRKGGELAANPWAALVFYWPELERQVRVEGSVAPLPPEESDAYFASRPPGSRLGAWASAQSRVIPKRAVLEARMTELEAEYPQGSTIPRPPYWGGFRVTPTSIEFWQGRLNRLHDRLRYTRQPDGGWLRERLSP
jgi:pyridoxamine 5'-phosphate oxidase